MTSPSVTDSSSTQSGHTSLPPPFGGKPSESIVEFLIRYGLCAKANGWDEEKACFKLSTCLVGRALQVYLSLDSMIQSSYNAVRVALLCRLITPPYEAAATLRDRSLQRDESVDTLLYELNKLYSESHFVAPDLTKPIKDFPSFSTLIKTDTSDSYHRDMILKVLDALPPDIASRLRVMKFTKVEDLAEQARIELATQSYDSNRDPFKTVDSTVAPLSLTDEQEEIDELRQQVAALTDALTNEPDRSYGFNRTYHRRPGKGKGGGKKWCTYHKTDTHWTSQCKAVARLASEREAGNGGNMSGIDNNMLDHPNGKRASEFTGASSAQQS
ncbi:hypothetical protein FOL47_000738 [Perkinsus chesapeaki]|uniref:Uncharacterized protein n=1 Tax=Perkinsus chesapeaki TaxID=330153 RepID=A0A7J6KVN0_PERCH|nr:hypothetical protein FOL47_000738 [Perkinsus chesapeaki]